MGAAEAGSPVWMGSEAELVELLEHWVALVAGYGERNWIAGQLQGFGRCSVTMRAASYTEPAHFSDDWHGTARRCRITYFRTSRSLGIEGVN
jgi:hypothetical protein